MNEQEIVVIKNALSRRTGIIAVLMAVTGSIILISLGVYFQEDPLITGIFAMMPFVLIVFAYLGALRVAIMVGVSSQGIQLVYRSGRKENISWKNVVTMKPVRLDPGFFLLIFLKEDGKKAFNILSEEPANQVRQMWIALHPDAEDLMSEPKFK
ncbi:MAG: hypothetical protein E3J35_05770 [Methanomassiliicoccales archaeon]|nr:MAG: hypothetical protein E3J35_05770 [Methanomassiliicoccales archaeon]